jgi:hypothetical protein
MAFINKIDFCVQKQSGEYVIIPSDITDIFDAGDNPNGWEDATTILAEDLNSAQLVITYTNSKDQTSTETINVLEQIDDPVTGKFDFSAVEYKGDGYYKIEYIIVADGETYKACKTKMPYVNVACCISKKIMKFSKEGCNCSSNTNFLKNINELKALEYAYLSSVKTVDKESALKLLKLMEDLCGSKSDCNCK